MAACIGSLVPGNREGKVLVVQNFRFHRHQIRGENIHWRCWRQNCRAKVYTNLLNEEDDDQVIRVIGFHEEHHTHPQDETMVSRAQFRQNVVAQVRQDPTVPVRRVYNAELVQHRRAVQGGGDRPSIPAFQSVRTTMQSARSEAMSEIPATVDEVEVAGSWAQDLFLLHADNDWGILVFATNENLTLLQQCRTTYMDATFRSCPRPYRQCFTILGNHHGFVLPLVHVLMEQRTIGHYRQVLQAVKVAIRQVTHHNWRPQLVVCDF